MSQPWFSTKIKKPPEGLVVEYRPNKLAVYTGPSKKYPDGVWREPPDSTGKTGLRLEFSPDRWRHRTLTSAVEAGEEYTKKEDN